MTKAKTFELVKGNDGVGHGPSRGTEQILYQHTPTDQRKVSSIPFNSCNEHAGEQINLYLLICDKKSRRRNEQINNYAIIIIRYECSSRIILPTTTSKTIEKEDDQDLAYNISITIDYYFVFIYTSDSAIWNNATV